MIKTKSPSPKAINPNRGHNTLQPQTVDRFQHRSPTRRLSAVHHDYSSNESDEDSDDGVISYNPTPSSITRSLKSPPRRIHAAASADMAEENGLFKSIQSAVFDENDEYMQNDDACDDNDVQDINYDTLTPSRYTPRTKRSEQAMMKARDALATLSNALGLLSLESNEISEPEWIDLPEEHDNDVDEDEDYDERDARYVEYLSDHENSLLATDLKKKHVHFKDSRELAQLNVREDMEPALVTVLTPIRAPKQLRQGKLGNQIWFNNNA